MNKCKIKLAEISDGKNTFKFEIRDEFFEAFTLSDVEYAEIISTALINKDGNNLALTLSIDGIINKLLCDMCADEISINISAKTNLLIKLSNENLVSTDEIIYIKKSEKIIDLQQLIFELIILNLPKKIQHSTNNNGVKCNKDMINLIKQYTIKKKSTYDTRWDALKDLKIK
tara:strand:- start:365 stop:880 length:516 start_codon:yes stop_codon:yes gene_type:complete